MDPAVLANARKSVEALLIAEARALCKKDLRATQRSSVEDKGNNMLRQLLPTTTSDSEMRVISLELCESVMTQIQGFLDNPSYRPRRNPTATNVVFTSNGLVPTSATDADTASGPSNLAGNTSEHDDSRTTSSTPGTGDGDADAVHTARCSSVSSATTKQKYDVIRCSMCFMWFHKQCMGIAKEEDLHWWLCLNCRDMGNKLRQLQLTVLTLNTNIQSLQTTVDTLLSSNVTLTTELSGLKAQLSKPVNTPHVSHTSQPGLLIGDSCIRDIKSCGVTHLSVHIHRGAKTCDTLKTLKAMPSNSASDIITHVGTNDSATKLPIDKIMDNYVQIITECKRVSTTGHITVSALCPRADDDNASTRGREINEQLQSLASDQACVYSSHDGNFRLQNGEANTALLHPIDRLHLSQQGVCELLKNLKLEGLASCSLQRSPTAPRPQNKSRPQKAAPNKPQRTSDVGKRMPLANPKSRPATPQNYKHGRNHEHRISQNGTYRNNQVSHEAAWSRSRDASRSHDTSRNTYQPQGSAHNDIRCYFCSERGHTHLQCGYKRYVKCLNCGGFGHKSKFCRNY